MQSVVLRPQSAMHPMARKRGPPTALRIETPPLLPLSTQAVGEYSASSALSSAVLETDSANPFRPASKASSIRNMKKLSLTLPSAQSSENSLSLPPSEAQPSAQIGPDRSRRLSVLSLPAGSTNNLLHRKDEDADGSPSAPYVDGPIQIIPGVWLGSEDNARDWKCLVERGIKSILNVAKEVSSPLDSAIAQPMRPFQSTPNTKSNGVASESTSTFYPAHIPSGRPGMHYLKLHWSHGQSDLVEDGFPAGMKFIDAALERGEGVLVHCQCGISRSATMVIALVMRAAATQSTLVPPEVWALKGMQGAYAFVKEKSKWAGPNMSLIYQLMEYERTLKGGNTSPAPSERSSNLADEEEEWGRRRKALEESPSSNEDDRESIAVMREAQALDKAMEERIVARKSSASSVASSGLGMGAAWRTRYNSGRKRTGSHASNTTNGSLMSEHLVEEDEQQELLGVGGGFDDASIRHRSPSLDFSSSSEDYSPGDAEPAPRRLSLTQLSSRQPPQLRIPPSAPAHKSTFQLPPMPATAVKSSFQLPPTPSTARTSFPQNVRIKTKTKHRPPQLSLLPTVPSSPIVAAPAPAPAPAPPPVAPVPLRARVESKKLAPPPLFLRSHSSGACSKLPFPRTPSFDRNTLPVVQTPSQTLFVFPPSPTKNPNPTRTPSTMTLTSNMNLTLPFPTMSTPRVSTFRSQGRTRSFIGLGAPATPTTASSRVDARGWIGAK